MNLSRQFALLVVATALGLGLAGCQPSTQKAPPVAQLASVAISGGAVTLDVGGAASLVLIATYTDGTTSDASFNATFTSSAPAIVSVSATGSLRGVAPGTATVTATHSSGRTATVSVTVLPLRVTAIAVTNAAPVTVRITTTLQLVVTGTFNNATTGNVTAGSTFVSSNPAVATVSAAGVVTGVSLGSVTINVTHTASGATSSVGVAVVEPPRPTTAPATVIPSGSVTIYSESATVANFNPFPFWGQNPPVTFSEPTLAGNRSLQYGFAGPGGLYQGLDWAANPVNVSTKARLHIDFWTPDLTSVQVSIISAGLENAVTVSLTAGNWNSIDIDLSRYTVPDKTAIIQIKLEPNAAGTLYVDNVYFWGDAAGISCGTTAPTCAPATSIPGGSLTIYSETTTVPGFEPFPYWGQNPPVTFSQPTIAGNRSLQYGFAGPGGLYQGLDWSGNPVNVSGRGRLHIDFWTPNLTSVQVSIISAGPLENFVTVPLTPGNWNSVDIDLSRYTVPDKTAIIQIKLEPNAAGTLYVDNIYFWGTPGGGGGGTGCADAGCGGPQTLAIATGNVRTPNGGITFFVANEGIFAIDYEGSAEPNPPFNRAGWPGARTVNYPGVTNAAGGSIGYFQDDATLTNSSQKVEEGGYVSGSILDANGAPNFFRYFIMRGPAFTNSYMGLFVNAANNGTVDVSAFSRIKFRLWGPRSMYELSYSPAGIEVTLAGPRVPGCTTGSGGTEIAQTFTADQKIGAASEYRLPMSGFTVKGVCGTDTNATAVASVRSRLASVIVTVPGTAFNFTLAEPSTNPPVYAIGMNLSVIGFTNN
jgi:hypothetical protein